MKWKILLGSILILLLVSPFLLRVVLADVERPSSVQPYVIITPAGPDSHVDPESSDPFAQLYPQNPLAGDQLDTPDMEKGFLSIYTASGDTKTIPTSSFGTISSISLNGSTSIFINDVRGGDKIDILLRNYTMLSDGEYLQDGRIRVIVLLGEMVSQEAYNVHQLSHSQITSLSHRIHQFDGEVNSAYSCFPFLEIELPYEKIFELEKETSVAHIFLDKKYRVRLTDSVPVIKPSGAWEEVESCFGFEINGTSAKVAILDTGIDKDHPDLDDLDDNHSTHDLKVIAEECFTNEAHVWDGFGHGTHCASIAAGTGEASNYTNVGMAPGAFLLNGKVLTDSGWGYDSWIIKGIEWAVNNSADVISMSFGAAMNGDGTDPLSMAVDWATGQGVVCVVAAGNSGGGGMFTVGIPAVSRTAITVGATTKMDEIVYFSSQGPTSDYRLKPDVCAPGVDIVAARANGTSMGIPINDFYTKASGTSMATPHVAGAAALILQARPDWNSTLVKSALMGSAKTLIEEHVWREGAGRIDVVRSVTTMLLVIEPSSSFVMPGLGSILNTTVTLINVANVSAEVDISALTFCEGNEVDYVSVDATSLIIPPYENTRITLQVGPLDQAAPEGWYEGWLNLTSPQCSAKAPYFFSALSTITVNVYDMDNVTPIEALMVLATYPHMTYVDFAGTSFYGSRYQPAVLISKSGDYVLCAQMGWIDDGSWPHDFTRTFMIEKVFSVPKLSTINVSISLAEAKASYLPTVDSSGNNLTVHSYMQYFCGGYQRSFSHYSLSEWSLGSGWFGFDLNVSHLTFYSSEYTPSNRLSEALGYYASSPLLSEVYLMPFKFWNVTSLPDTISCPTADLAKYHIFYDMPETYPENGLNSMNAFWFTWDHIGGFQIWFWDVHRVFAGINATYYLAPGNGTYFGYYMPTYEGWRSYVYGPIQEWSIGRHHPYPQIPPGKGETGSRILGKTSLAPYQPGLSLNISSSGSNFEVSLTGDIWNDLSWPHWQWIMLSPLRGPISPYPQHYPEYRVYINQTLFDQGKLNGKNGYEGEPYVDYPPYFPDVDWCGISETWNITGGEVLIQLTLPSLATISRNTVYNISFTLGGDDSTPPIITGISFPFNYRPGEDLRLNFAASDVDPGIRSHFLKYSFNNGTTWQDAYYEEPHYIISCEEADSIAVLANVTDDSGNSIQYFSSPIALCRTVNLTVTDQSPPPAGGSMEVSGNLTTVEGKGIHCVAVALSTDGIIYTPSNPNGAFTFIVDAPLANETYLVSSPSVGLYGSAWTPVSHTSADNEVADIVIDQAIVSDGRCDVGTTQTVWMHAKWGQNGSDVSGGSIYVNATGYVTNQTGWISFNETYSTVGNRMWNITGVHCNGVSDYENQYSIPRIIWDRIKVTDGGASRTHTNVTQTETVWFRGAYEFDGEIFNQGAGNLYVNSSVMNWSSTRERWEQDYAFNTSGTRRFKVSNVSDNRYGLTVINDAVGPVSINWARQNDPPTASIMISPNGGEVWANLQTLTWTASMDPNGDPVTYRIEYSNDSGSTWYCLAGEVSGTHFEWNTTEHTDGNEYLIRVKASDGSRYSDWDASDEVFTIDNTSPTIVDYGPTGVQVPVDTKIVIMFSESMNQTSSEEAFSTQAITPGSFSWTNNTMTFTPDIAVEYDTTYNVTISTEVIDAARNNLRSIFRWSFTTTSAPPPPPPTSTPRPPPTPPPSTSVVEIDLSMVSRHRCDVGSTQTVQLHAILNGDDVVDGTIYVNETAYLTNATGWISFDCSSVIVGKRTWIVTGVDYADVTRFKQATSNPTIVWDRIGIVDGGASRTLANITMPATVWYRAIYEYDGSSFEDADGVLYLNGSAMIWSSESLRWEAKYAFNTAGTRSFRISGASDIRYGLKRLSDAVGSLSITWVEYERTSEGVTYVVPIVSHGAANKVPVTTNSTISNFSVDPAAKQVNLTVSGPTGTTGTTKMTIPKQLLNGRDLQVYLDNRPHPFTLTENDTCCFIHLIYVHSQHHINLRFVDLTTPSLSILFPGQGAQLNFSSLTVIWNGSDMASGIHHYEVRLDEEAGMDSGTNASHSLHELKEGSHTVHVKAMDMAGNVEEVSTSFIIDLAPPRISIISPLSDATVNSSSFKITWSGSDDVSGIDYCELKLDRGLWVCTGNETSYALIEVDDGNHTICVRAEDKAGNSIEKRVTFLVGTSTVRQSEFMNNALVSAAGLMALAILAVVVLRKTGI